MALTFLHGEGSGVDQYPDTIDIPGADTMPVGATQIAFGLRGDTDLPSSDFVEVLLPHGTRAEYRIDVNMYMRRVTASSQPTTITGRWASTFTVSETLEYVSLDNYPMHYDLVAHAGDILVSFQAEYTTLSYGNSGPKPDGFTTILQNGPRWYPYQISYDTFESDETRAIMNQPVRNNTNVMLKFKASQLGTQFQIKHNGALIPATPNLWSGGQLTPVALNRPE